MRSPDLTTPAPTVAGSYDRVRAIDETLGLEPALRARCGITRVAELTYLDRIGIPVYAAIVPDSNDSISVYNGKGLTREAARAGALMEAAERYATAHATPMMRRAGYDVIGDVATVVDVSRCWTSNGVAAGNTLAEAIYHALCEVIERHVISVVHAIAHARPRELLARFAGRRAHIPGFVDDSVATEYAVPTGSAAVDDVIRRVVAADIHVRLRAVELPPLPAVFIATLDHDEADVSRVHVGFGCSLSPEHAAIRALTEAVQSRLCDIQAAREDVLTADDPRARVARRQTMLPHGRWYFDVPARPATFGGAVDRSSCDLSADVRTVIATLRAAGFRHAVVVDLSPPGLAVQVVRAVVPGMESAMIDGSAGPLIRSILDSHDLDALRSALLPEVAHER